MDNDFWEFVQHVEDDQNYLAIPRYYIRDLQNPLERYCNDELVKRFRFSRPTIQIILLPLVFPEAQEPDNLRGLPAPPVIKMCLALRFYATGIYQRVCSDLHEISQTTACRIIKEISQILARHLQHYVKFPSSAGAISRNRQQFYQIGGFPGVVGCIDGTHIEIKSPGGPTAEVYRNRKSWMSLNIQVVAGPDAEIFDIVIRWPGSAHDSRIFNSSSLKVRFEQRHIHGLLLGDSAYPQLGYLYTPLLNPATRAERRYNSAQLTTRNVVERTFGQWKQRFRCLNKCLNYNLRTTVRIIAATAVLHNIAVKEREQFIPDPNFVERMIPVPPAAQNARGNLLRAAFIERHFLH